MNLFLSLAVIILLALLLSSIFKIIKLPTLIGMLLTGIILGPYVLNFIAHPLLALSDQIRQFALIVILTRAGLSLKTKELKRVGRPAILLSFLPATFEILSYFIFATLILQIPRIDALIMGAVISAVSPAVVVSRMIKIKEQGYGVNKSIPQLITAGSSLDDIFVIVLFTTFMSIKTGAKLGAKMFYQVPISIILGILVGLIFGYMLYKLFKIIHIRDTIKVLIILSFSFIVISIESLINDIVPFSGLIAIIAMSIVFYKKSETQALRISEKYSKIWVISEILLFVLIGAKLQLSFLSQKGGLIIATLLIGLIFRAIGVLFCLIKTNLITKEKIFCVISYMPKATVQAAIGAIPLSVGIDNGGLVLASAVVSILITAPLGAVLIDFTYKKLLKKNSIA